MNFPDYDMEASEGEDKLPEIKFTNDENVVLNLIEDINDKLNKDINKKSSRRSAVDIAFFDVGTMSGPMQALYLTLMLGVIFGSIYYFYYLLVEKPEQKEAEKRRLREEKKKKKKQW